MARYSITGLFAARDHQVAEDEAREDPDPRVPAGTITLRVYLGDAPD